MQPSLPSSLSDSAYFLPRSELLSWVNSLLGLSVQKIEHLCTGAVYCQLVEAYLPGTVAMHRVNWRARNEYEFVGNYKVLQNAFLKAGVTKPIDIERLVKGKYQDNLEFLQWLKHFFDPQHRGVDPVERRKVEEKPRSNKGRSPTVSEKSSPVKGRCHEGEELKVIVDALEKERDYYYLKLQHIEHALQHYHNPGHDLAQLLQQILYASEDSQAEIGTSNTLPYLR